MSDALQSAIHDLIFDSEAYWPDDNYFHRRNRQKLATAWGALTSLHNLSRSAVVDQFTDILQRRHDQKVPTLYAMSNGGAGCHYLGQLLDGLPGLRLTDEVYIPPRLLRETLKSKDEQAALAIDFVNFFHAGTVAPEDRDLSVVNIGHLHPDTHPIHLAKVDVHGRFILLLRNPYDVAVSRALRKPDYRSKVAPDMSDDEYLQRQAEGTKAFLSRAGTFTWHHIVRYEELTADPLDTVRRLAQTLDLPFDEDQFEAGRRRIEAETAVDAHVARAGNLNTESQELLTPRQLEILRETLGEWAGQFGYEESDLMARSDAERSRSGAPSPSPSTKPAVEPWVPAYVKVLHYNGDRFERLDQGYLRVSNHHGEVDLPTDPTWTADPFTNKTWRLFYHGLGWLAAYAWGADHGPDPAEARRRLDATVRDYFAANVFSPAADDYAWNDHSTADRLAILTFLHAGGYLLGPDQFLDEDQLTSAGEIHVDRLVEFHESGTWLASNHGLFHALALLNFASVFPKSPKAGIARTVGGEYLKTVVENLVETEEGVCLEQAPRYHQFDLALLRTIHEFLTESYPDLAHLLDGVTDRMVDFNLCTRTAANIMPPVGDTALGVVIPDVYLSPAAGETHTEHFDYIDSQGQRGEPFPPLVVYPNSGYSVFRRGEVFDGAVTRGVFVHQPERIAHGHWDALSLTLHIAGRDVLVDSGGPYSYGDALRFLYFMVSRAHNVVLIDDQDHTAPSRLVGHGEELDCQWVTAEHAGYEGRVVSRTVVAVADAGFVVFDTATAGPAESTFDLLWHFAPDSTVTPVVDGRRTKTTVQIEDDTFVAHALLSARPTVEVVEGRLEPKPQGWVTEAPEKKRPAPVLVTSVRGTSLLAATAFAPDGTKVAMKQAGDSVVVRLGGRAISLRPGTPPTIRAHAGGRVMRLSRRGR